MMLLTDDPPHPRTASEYEKLALTSIASLLTRTTADFVTLGAVFSDLHVRLRMEVLPPLSLPGVVSTCARLSAINLLLADHYRNGLQTTLRLNISEEDLTLALAKEV